MHVTQSIKKTVKMQCLESTKNTELIVIVKSTINNI